MAILIDRVIFSTETAILAIAILAIFGLWIVETINWR